MTIKQQGGIFGRNPTFNDVDVEGTMTTGSITTSGNVDVQSGFLQVSADPTPVIRLSGDGNNAAFTTFGELQFFNNDVSGVGPNVAAFVKAKSFSSTGGGGELYFGTIGSAGSEGQEATEQVKIDLSGNVNLIGGGNVVVASGSGIDFGSNTLVDVNNGVPVSKTVGSSVTDVAHITTSSGGYTNFIFEVYAFSSGNNMPAKGTILARGYSGGWATVELKDEQLSGTTPINLSVGNSGADLIVKATQPNSSTLTMFIKSIYKTNVSITVA